MPLQISYKLIFKQSQPGEGGSKKWGAVRDITSAYAEGFALLKARITNEARNSQPVVPLPEQFDVYYKRARGIPVTQVQQLTMENFEGVISSR